MQMDNWKLNERSDLSSQTNFCCLKEDVFENICKTVLYGIESISEFEWDKNDELESCTEVSYREKLINMPHAAEFISQVISFLKNLKQSIPGSRVPQTVRVENGKIPLKEQTIEQVEELVIMSKFHMDPHGHVAGYGDASLFHKGLDHSIGIPHFDIAQGIEKEHCQSADSNDLFLGTNYGIETTPAQEFEFVYRPDSQKTYPGNRKAQNLCVFLNLPQCKDAKLLESEVLALRLYTGPMFVKYNAVLRRFPTGVVDLLKGNSYVSTIHAIASGIKKLCQVTKLPPGRKVYRGLGGLFLPDKFWKGDEYGCKGGVEYGFLSTTPNRDIALMYSGKQNGIGTVFEIELGQIDRGACIKWLSQFPEEEEILMSPLSNLELIGEPKLGPDSVLIMKLRINVNFQCQTLEQLFAARKQMVLSQMKHHFSEARLIIQSEYGKSNPGVKAVVQFLDQELQSKLDTPPKWFNDDTNLVFCQVEMMRVKQHALEVVTKANEEIAMQMNAALVINKLRRLNTNDDTKSPRSISQAEYDDEKLGAYIQSLMRPQEKELQDDLQLVPG